MAAVTATKERNFIRVKLRESKSGELPFYVFRALEKEDGGPGKSRS